MYALFSPLVAGIFLIIASAAGLILALKDISENGLNAKNASLLLVSAIGLIAGTFLALGTTAGAIMMILTGGILTAISFVDMLNNGFTLQFAIDECHKRCMELHAWVVTIPVGKWNALGCKTLLAIEDPLQSLACRMDVCYIVNRSCNILLPR